MDRTVKRRMDATVAILEYWIVNLRDNVIETYQRPDVLSGEYRDRRDYRRGDNIQLTRPGYGVLSVAVSDIIVD